MSEQRFPKRTKSQAIGEIGISIVGKIVRKDLGWEFRRTPQESDFGIDGYIDVVTDGGHVTGRSLAVQVKSGSSYFRSTGPEGFIYRGETKHINYYLNLGQPVLLILVDPQSERAWWEIFEPYETDRTGDRWTLPIRDTNIFAATSKATLDRFAGPSTDYIPHLEEFWLLSERIKDVDFVCIQVRKAEIENCYVRAFQRIFERLSISRSVALSAMNKIEFLIDGYNEDPRELYEIPEVVTWLDAAVSAVKHLAFFLHLDEHAQGMRLICVCRGQPEKPAPGRVRLTNPRGVLDFMNQQFLWLNEFTVSHDVEDVNRAVSEKLSAFVHSILKGSGGQPAP